MESLPLLLKRKKIKPSKVFLFLAAIGVSIIALLILSRGFTTIAGHGDEDYWITGSGASFEYFSSGKVFDPIWENNIWLFHRPEAAHLIIGFSMRLSGVTYGETQIVEVDKTKNDYGKDYIWEKPKRSFEKSPELLRAARAPMVLLAVGSVTLLWVVMGLYLSLPAAALAVYFLLTNNVFVGLSKQVMTDTMPLFFELLVFLAMFIFIKGKKGRYSLLALAAFFSALSVSIRYTTIHSFTAVNLFFLVFYWAHGRNKLKHIFTAHLLFNVVFFFVFYILDPTLYLHPFTNLKLIIESWAAINKVGIDTVGSNGLDTSIMDRLLEGTYNQGFLARGLIVLGCLYLGFSVIREISLKKISERTLLFLWVFATVLYFIFGVTAPAPRYLFMLSVAFIILQAFGFHFSISCFKQMIIMVRFVIRALSRFLDPRLLNRIFFAMAKNMKTKVISLSFRRKSILLFIFLFCLSFSGILFSNKIIGFTWDWNYPINSFQASERLVRNFYAWYSRPSLGIPASYTSSGLPFSLLLYGLSFLPAFLAQRVFIFIVFLLAFIGGFALCQYFKWDRYISLFVSLIYTFSSPLYSRLVAGHLNVFLGIALLPLIFLFLLKSLEKKRIRDILLTVVLLSVASSHFMTVFNIIFLVLATLLLFLFPLRQFSRRLKVVLVIALGYIILNAYWILPFAVGVMTDNLSYKALGTVANEINLSWQVFLRSPMTLIDVLTLKAPAGMSTEYIFPEPEVISTIRLFVNLAFFVFTLWCLFKYRRRDQWVLFVGCFLGINLVLGPKSILGTFIYRLFIKIAPPVFFLFANTNRFNILLNFSFLFMIGFTLHYLLRNRRPGEKIFFLLFLLLVNSFPFLTMKIAKPSSGTQAYALITKQFSPLDGQIYKEMTEGKNYSRVSLMPSSDRVYLPNSQYSFPWLSLYLGKDEFYGHDPAGGDYGKFIYANLYWPDMRTLNLSKFLGLAAVERVFFYRAQHYLYHSFGYLEQPEGYQETLFDPHEELRITLDQQRGLRPIRDVANDLTLYTNDDYKPRITIANKIYIATGNFEVLESLFNSGLADLPLVFSRQISNGQLPNKNAFFILSDPESYYDLYLPFLKQSEIFYPGQIVQGFSRGWVKTIGDWDRDYVITASLNKELLAKTKGEGAFSFKVNTEKGPYVFLLRALRNSDAGKLLVEFDKQRYQITLRAENELGFRWGGFLTDELSEGEHKIKIKSLEGENCIGPVVILSKERYDETERRIAQLLTENNFAMLLEAEQLAGNEKQVVNEGQASVGQGVVGNLSFHVNIPSTGVYGVSLRLKQPDCSYKGNITLQNFTNSSQAQMIVSCNDDCFIQNMGSIKMVKGINKLELNTKRQGIIVDQIIFTKGELLSGVGWRELSYEGENPSRYVIEISRQEKPPFFINFAENYSNKWRLFDGQTEIEPIKSYGFSNLYYVQNRTNRDDKLTLEYADQKYLNVGLVITLISYLSLGLLFLWKREGRL